MTTTTTISGTIKKEEEKEEKEEIAAPAATSLLRRTNMITRAVNITPALIPDPEPLPVIQDTNSDREELTPSSPASSESSELKKEIEKVDFENLMYSTPPTTVPVPVKPKS